MQAISQRRLYVVRFPILDNITADENATGAFRGEKMLSPIALFVSTKNRSSPLKPIAIQLGNTGEL